VIVVVMMGPVYVHACAVRRAKSANLIDGVPVTFWTLSLGRRFAGWAQAGRLLLAEFAVDPFAQEVEATERLLPAEHGAQPVEGIGSGQMSAPVGGGCCGVDTRRTSRREGLDITDRSV
jgi:hypothetical protein